MMTALRPATIPALVLGLLGVFSASASHAAGGPVTVQGVVIPPPRIEPPPAQRLGFLDRIENPIVELRPVDPFPDCFVFLDGGPAAPDAAAPPKSALVWQLESNSFSPPLLPVVAGATVEIANVGRETHLLVAPAQPDLLPKDPIGPGSSKTVTAAGQDVAILIESRSSPHLRGRVVPLPTRYFGRLDRNGKFKIENVPPGKWTVRLWFRDGWASLPARTIDVPGKDVRIDVPPDALAPAAGGK
jgi:hypothetical protein